MSANVCHGTMPIGVGQNQLAGLWSDFCRLSREVKALRAERDELLMKLQSVILEMTEIGNRFQGGIHAGVIAQD